MLIRIFRNVGNVNVQPQIARVVRVYNYNTPSGITSDIVTAAGQLIGSDGDGSPVAITAPSIEGQLLVARLGQTPKMAWETVDLSQLTQTSAKTAAYTAVANDHVLVNAASLSADIQIDLPASPANGTKVRVTLLAAHATYKVTIGRNGSNVNGGTTTSVFTLRKAGDSFYFEYTGSTLGWIVINSAVRSQARAWVLLNGTGTIAIRDEFNVSSITDNGTGDYTITFATALTSANYTVTGGGSRSSDGTQPLIVGIKSSTAPSTTAVRVQLLGDGGVTDDSAYTSVVIHGA